MKRHFEELAYHLRGGASLINHRHQNPESYEIIQILSGEGTAFLMDRTYPLSAGMLLLIDAASLHCITPQEVSCYSRNKLILDKRYLQAMFSAIEAQKILEECFQHHMGSCFYLNESQSKMVDELFKTMQDAFAREEAEKNLCIASALMSIFLLCSGMTQQVAPREDDKLAPVMQYLRTHYAEPLTVAQIAEQTHLSKYYLCHLFRRQTGLTLMQYLYEHRLSAARQQLMLTKRSISAIAQDCGFSSSSHFCTLFRRREGMSPKEYRSRIER